MSWFGSEKHVEQAVKQAMRIAERRPLPVAARSLTRAELIDKHRNRTAVAAFAVVLALIVILFFTLGEGGGGGGTVLAITLIALPAMFVAGWAWIQRFREYRDPRIRIAADGAGVTFTGPLRRGRWPGYRWRRR